MNGQLVADEPIRVVVTPSQASYFAGERFSVTITITNTKPPQPTLLPGSSSQSSPYSHKRGAHSVSYVPMSRPPTSPGIRTALPVPSTKLASKGQKIVRRGVVGKPRPSNGSDDQAEALDPARRRLLLNRSLSISLADDFLTDDTKGKSPIRTIRALETSTVPCMSLSSFRANYLNKDVCSSNLHVTPCFFTFSKIIFCSE